MYSHVYIGTTVVNVNSSRKNKHLVQLAMVDFSSDEKLLDAIFTMCTFLAIQNIFARERFLNN